ncbi:MAG: DUF504 domain-containing protein [Euryarchaeota archaeon]|nr:DUF504 domain-containing protein [Euryarchaeota archaeon]
MTKGRNVPGSPRTILLRAKHSPEGFENLTITYVDRGAVGDVKTVQGRDVVDIERGLLELKTGARIPMHRIVKIRDGGHLLFLRRAR